MEFDTRGQQTVINLSNSFNTVVNDVQDILIPYSVGIEVEVKFKYYFPELHVDYFKNNLYYSSSYADRQQINQIISNREKETLLSLEKTIDCGIPKGLDRYWEFSFNPVYNLKYLVQQIMILKDCNLIPKGRHSLHITIGGVTPTAKIYWALAYLQLLYVDKQRILDGFKDNQSSTWGKKGWAGILPKNDYDLIDNNIGLELRTLYIDENTDIIQLFTKLGILLNKIYRQQRIELFDNLAKEYEMLGLPNKNWGRPHENQNIWLKYAENYDYLSNFAKSLILE